MENETEAVDPRPLLLKRFIWDVFPHDEEYRDDIEGAQRRLGLVPDHPDGAKMSHDESDLRLAAVRPLSKLTEILSRYVSEVISTYLIMSMENNGGEVPEDFSEGFKEQNEQVLFFGATAIIAHLFSSGLVTYSDKTKDIARKHGKILE